MASKSFPEHTTQPYPMQYPAQISTDDTLLASRLNLPNNPSIVYAIYAADINTASRPQEHIELARRSILSRNASSTLLDSFLPSVYIGPSSRLYVFKIITVDQAAAAISTLSSPSFEGLIAEEPQSFTPQDLYPCSPSCAILPRGCPSCLCADGFSSDSGSSLPVRASLRRIYSHFLEALRNRMLDDIVKGSCSAGNLGPNVRRKIFQFRNGVILGPPTAPSVSWGSGWKHNAVGRPFLYSHMQVHLASSHNNFHVLLHPIIVPTPYLSLSTSLPVPPGTPVTLVPFGTPAYFLTTYSGPTSALTSQFQESLKGRGVDTWLQATKSSSQPSRDKTRSCPSALEPSYIIAWIKVENKQGEAKGITIIWPTELTLSYTPSSAPSLRPPLDYIPILPAQLQPSPEVHVHSAPPLSSTTATASILAATTTAITSPTIAQPHPVPYHQQAFHLQSSPLSLHPSTPNPSVYRPSLPPSPTTESIRAFRTLTLSKSKDIRKIATEVGGYVEAVVRERDRERERLKKEREGAINGSGVNANGSPRLMRATPGVSNTPNSTTTTRPGSPSMSHIHSTHAHPHSPQPPQPTASASMPPVVSAASTPTPMPLGTITTSSSSGGIYPVLPSIPGVVAPPAPVLPIQQHHAPVSIMIPMAGTPIGPALNSPVVAVGTQASSSSTNQQSRGSLQPQVPVATQTQTQTQAQAHAQMFYPSPPHSNSVTHSASSVVDAKTSPMVDGGAAAGPSDGQSHGATTTGPVSAAPSAVSTANAAAAGQGTPQPALLRPGSGAGTVGDTKAATSSVSASANEADYDPFNWVNQSSLDMGMGMDMGMDMGSMNMDMSMSMGMGMDVDMDFGLDMGMGFGSLVGNLGFGATTNGNNATGIGTTRGGTRVVSNGSTSNATTQNRAASGNSGGGSGLGMGLGSMGAGDFEDAFTDDDFSFFDKPSAGGGGTALAPGTGQAITAAVAGITFGAGVMGSSAAAAIPTAVMSSASASPSASFAGHHIGTLNPLYASPGGATGPAVSSRSPALANVGLTAAGPAVSTPGGSGGGVGVGSIMSPMLATSPSSLFDGGHPTPGPMSPVVSTHLHGYHHQQQQQQNLVYAASSPWNVGISLNGSVYGQGFGQGPESMFPSPPNDTPRQTHSVPHTPQVQMDDQPQSRLEGDQVKWADAAAAVPGGWGADAKGVFDPIPFDPCHRVADGKYSFGKFAFSLPSPDPTELACGGEEDEKGSLGRNERKGGDIKTRKPRRRGHEARASHATGEMDRFEAGDVELLPPFKLKRTAANKGESNATTVMKGWKYSYDAATDPRIAVVKKLIGVKRKRAVGEQSTTKRCKMALLKKNIKVGLHLPSWLKLDRYRGQNSDEVGNEVGYGYGYSAMWDDEDADGNMNKKRFTQRKPDRRRKQGKSTTKGHSSMSVDSLPPDLGLNSPLVVSSDSDSYSTNGDDSDSYSDTDSNMSTTWKNEESDPSTTPNSHSRPSTPPPSYLPLGPTLIQTYFHHSLLLPLSSPLRPPLASSQNNHASISSGLHQPPPPPISVPTPVSPAAMAGAASEKSKTKELVAQVVAREVVENWVWGEAWWTNNYHHSGFEYDASFYGNGMGGGDGLSAGANDAVTGGHYGGGRGVWSTVGSGGAGLKRGMMEVWMADVQVVAQMMRSIDGLEGPMNMGGLFGIGDVANRDADVLMSSPSHLLDLSSGPERPLQPFEPPMISVAKGDAMLQVLPSALRFWEKLGLGPRAGKKNVEAYVLFEEDATGEEKYDKIEAWLMNVATVYQDKHYGDHVPGKGGHGPRPGLIPLRFDSSFKKTLPTFISSIPNTESNLVFYIMTPTPTMSLSSATLRTILITLKKILKHTFATPVDAQQQLQLQQQQPDYPQPLLQFVPDQIFYSLENPAVHNSTISALCNSTYNRILVPVDRYMSRVLHPPQADQLNSPQPPTTPTSSTPPIPTAMSSAITPLFRRYFEEPSITLSRPICNRISYVRASDRARGATLDVADRYTLCHVGYGISGDGKWLLASAVDQRGEGHDLGVWSIPSSCYGFSAFGAGAAVGDTGSGSAGNASLCATHHASGESGEEVEVSLESFIICQVWRFAVQFAGRANVEWRIVIARLGVISEREAIAWKIHLEHVIRTGRDIKPIHVSLVCADAKTPWTFMTSTPTVPSSSSSSKPSSKTTLGSPITSSLPPSSPYLANRASLATSGPYAPSHGGLAPTSSASSGLTSSIHNTIGGGKYNTNHSSLSSSQAVFTDISSITYAIFSKTRTPIAVPPTMGDLGLTLAYVPDYPFSQGQNHAQDGSHPNGGGQSLNSGPVTPNAGGHVAPSSLDSLASQAQVNVSQFLLGLESPGKERDVVNDDDPYDLPHPITLLPKSTTTLIRAPNNTPSPTSIQMLNVHLIFESWHSPRTTWWVRWKEKIKWREERRRERVKRKEESHNTGATAAPAATTNSNASENEENDNAATTNIANDYDELLRHDLAKNWYELSVLSKERWRLNSSSVFSNDPAFGAAPFGGGGGGGGHDRHLEVLPFHLAAVEVMKSVLERDGERRGGVDGSLDG